MATLNIGDRVEVNDPSMGPTVGKVLAVLDSKVRVLFEVNRPSISIAQYPIDKFRPFEGNNEDNNGKFWMVVGNGSSFVRHTSKKSADIEAERLAKANPSVEFFVLESVSAVKAAEVVKRTL